MLKKYSKFVGVSVAIMPLIACSPQTASEVESDETVQDVGPTDFENLTVYGDITESVQQLDVEGQEDEEFSYYSEDVQTELNEQLDELKVDSTTEDPLFVMNPFGTITNGLYMYFADPDVDAIEYTISVADEQIPDFTQTTVNHGDADNEFESLIFGLVPDETNNVSISYLDENGEELGENEFSIDMGPVGAPEFGNQLEITEDNKPEELSEGLFVVMGSRHSGEGDYTYLVDNAGVIRAELQLNGFRMDNLEMLNDEELLIDPNLYQLSTLNGLGQVVRNIPYRGYQKHHDFTLTDDNKILLLASDDNYHTVEDMILLLDPETGDYEELIDLKELFPEYEENFELGTMNEETETVDWFHANSIDLTNGDEIILSSREMSSLVKISNIYDEPQIDYIIGLPEFWEGSGYEDLLLDKEGDFPEQAGQHDARFIHDDSLEDGQYYVTIFNNNYWWTMSRPEYNGPAPDNVNFVNDVGEEYNPSTYYKYLVDENEGSYELVDSIDLPYSAIVSNAQPYEDNIVVNSGTSFFLQEYNDSGKLLREYSYDSSDWLYRIFKHDFSGFFYQ